MPFKMSHKLIESYSSVALGDTNNNNDNSYSTTSSTNINRPSNNEKDECGWGHKVD